MPVNKNAFIRYRIIDQCLHHTEKKWSKKELCRQVNRYLTSQFGEAAVVTESTIRHDLNCIELEFDAPLERYPEKSPRYYRYSEPDYSLFNTPLSPSDQATLTRALELLSSIEGMELAEEVQPVIARLQNRLFIEKSGSRKAIQFDHQPVADGTAYIEDLAMSIQQKTALKLTYKPFNSSKPKTHHFHPYLLKEYNSRWFCMGYSSLSKKLLILALDRISARLQILKENYVDNDFFDPQTYFNDIIGVTKPANAKKETIIVEVNADRIPYLKTKPLHISQRIIEKKHNGDTIIELDLIVNKELVATLLGFGKDIKVRNPAILKEKLKVELQHLIQFYK